jgi:hypothetical protein
MKEIIVKHDRLNRVFNYIQQKCGYKKLNYKFLLSFLIFHACVTYHLDENLLGGRSGAFTISKIVSVNQSQL